ncbi:uncharacterized protein LOC131289086 [Anopheles ziemanni]|uniref:AGAP013065-PA-like protein n=1 Tax=Anopheles sinensis TaxID=74873 RepID=A0A084VTX4_ANOSI|nr:uncharacterized protein LOC131259759 [Anopheles coustani]XP_058174269.1 uncharacterized protein LOC131289086 [Anopheles ziemanni]KFB41418.1 AGAP013065-PA-like protein [Anopheles sinensis]
MQRKLDPTGMYRRPGSASSNYQRSQQQQFHHQQFQNHQRMSPQQQKQHQVMCHYLDPTGLY